MGGCFSAPVVQHDTAKLDRDKDAAAKIREAEMGTAGLPAAEIERRASEAAAAGVAAAAAGRARS